jgi:hypothetical protein
VLRFVRLSFVGGPDVVSARTAPCSFKVQIVAVSWRCYITVRDPRATNLQTSQDDVCNWSVRPVMSMGILAIMWVSRSAWAARVYKCLVRLPHGRRLVVQRGSL